MEYGIRSIAGPIERTLLAKLYFRYGAMNSGKSTGLLQAAFNYEERASVSFSPSPMWIPKAIPTLCPGWA
ncbi:thymidine kinase [Arthrobacter sp. Hiyo4]|nr:thymidine kinase [Arthrobacter sp. Hiyo4]